MLTSPVIYTAIFPSFSLKLSVSLFIWILDLELIFWITIDTQENIIIIRKIIYDLYLEIKSLIELIILWIKIPP